MKNTTLLQLYQVIEKVFENFQLEKGEFIEIVYDIEGNRNFALARHIRSFEELEKFLSIHTTENITFCPALRRPSTDKIDKRTGSEYITRLRAIVFDIENQEEHKDKEKAIDPIFIQNYIKETLEQLPEPFQQAQSLYTAYTGGGGQIGFLLDRWIDRQESETLFQLLSDYIKDQKEKGLLKYIDLGALKPAQPLRLITTKNQTRNIETFFFEVNKNAELVKVDNLLTFLVSYYQNKTEEERIKKIEEKQEKEKNKKAKAINLKEVIKQIKEKLSFKDIYDFQKMKEYSHYYVALCPFHSESHPSFAVYKSPTGELAVDFHDRTIYDVISFYQKIYNTNFITAVKELAALAGIKHYQSFEKQKKKGKKEIPEVQITALAERLWESFNIKQIFYTLENDIVVYEFITENIFGTESRFSISAGDIAVAVNNFEILSFAKLFRKKLANAAGHITTDEELEVNLEVNFTTDLSKNDKRELREKIWYYIANKIKNLAQNDVENSLDYEIFSDFELFIKQGKATTDWHEFIANDGIFKFIDENGNVYLHLKSMFRMLQTFSPFKGIYTEKKVNSLLKKIKAKSIRITKNGKTIRVWLLSNNQDWIFSNDEEQRKIEKIQPEFNLKNENEPIEPVKAVKPEPIEQMKTEPVSIVNNKPNGNSFSKSKIQNKPNGNGNNSDKTFKTINNTEDEMQKCLANLKTLPDINEVFFDNKKCKESIETYYNKCFEDMEKEIEKIKNKQFDDDVPF